MKYHRLLIVVILWFVNAVIPPVNAATGAYVSFTNNSVIQNNWCNLRISAGFFANTGDDFAEEWEDPETGEITDVFFDYTGIAFRDAKNQMIYTWAIPGRTPYGDYNGFRAVTLSVPMPLQYTPPITATYYDVTLSSASPQFSNWTAYYNYLVTQGRAMASDSIDPTELCPPMFNTLIEVTQAVQDTGNTLPLIAEKDTYARVYITCLNYCSNAPVKGQLRSSRGGPTQNPVNNPPEMPIIPFNGLDFYRSSLSRSFNFKLPRNWINAGQLTLTFELADFPVPFSYQTTVEFDSARSIRVGYIALNYQGQVPPSFAMRDAVYFARQIMPTDELTYGQVWGSPLTISGCLPYRCATNQERIRATERLFNELSLVLARNRWRYEYIFGWVPGSNFPGGVIGEASRNRNVAYGVAVIDSLENSVTFAHELGHLLGRNHPNSNNSNCKPSDDNIKQYGLEVVGGLWHLIPPQTTFDVMTYCEAFRLWISASTWSGIAQHLGAPASPFVAPTAVQSYLFVSGLVYDDDTAEIDPALVIESDTPLDEPSTGTAYCLELQDAGNTALASQCFDLLFIDQETGEPTTIDGFAFSLPYPPGVSRLVLKKGAAILASRNVTANSPAVTVTSPNGSENWASDQNVTITWTGSDTDGDSLTYTVLYSADGVDYFPISTRITETQLEVNTANLPSGSAARIRVVASDGMNTSSDDSDIPFIVGGKGPQAYIDFPQADQTVNLGDSLLLEGSAFDMEDGDLSGAALSWASNLDGTLGTGDSLTAMLSAGQHVITLTATDNTSLTGIDTININVRTAPIDTEGSAPRLYLYQTSSVILEWSAISWAAGYELEINSQNSFNSPLIRSGLLPAYAPAYATNALPDGLYFWRVRAQRSDGTWGAWSAVESFVIDVP